jgi:tetratricopeptide (TPR) repeat protein
MTAFLALILLQSTVTPGVYQPALPEKPPATNPRTDKRKPKAVEGLNISDAARFEACIDQALEDPASAIVTANEWHVAGGSWLAKHCEGFALAEGKDFSQAADVLFLAAETAAKLKGPHVTQLYAQAGNAALAAGDAARALSGFDQALIWSGLTMEKNQSLGLIRVDRARALVALNRPQDAAADLAKAQALVPEDPLVWLLSATLARRSGDYARAQADLDIAAKLAPKDPAIALEAGNIAIKLNRVEAARKSWQSAIDVAPASAEAKTATAYLKQLEEALKE